MNKLEIIRDISTLLEQEEKDHYKPINAGNFWNNNYIECKSSGHRKKTLSVKQYLDKIKPYLGDIIINLQQSYTRKIQLKTAILFLLKMLMKNM